MRLRISAVLFILLFSVLLSACGGATEPSVTTASGTTANPEPVTTEEELKVPKTTYKGSDFVVLSAGQVAYDDFGFEEDSAGVLDSAQYIRRKKVEEEFDVKISIIIDENKSGIGNGSGYTRVYKSVTAGDSDYHMGLIGGMDVTTLAYSGYLAPLDEARYIDLDNSWWDQNANTDLKIMGKMFFTQGDITASKSECTYAIFYNKELGRAVQIEDPYQLVRDGKWTIDKFAEMCLTVSEDLDANGIRDMSDKYGLYAWDDSVLGIISAVGQKVATINGDGEFELSLYNETTLSAIEKFTEIAYNTDYAVMYQRYSNNGDVVSHWTNDQALFWANSTFITSMMREMNSDFGILPFPKLSEDQERYYSTIATYNSQFVCIPAIQEDFDYNSAIIEALAYYGKQIVKPAVYEKTIKGLYFRDDESIEMLDIINSSFIYDIGQLHRIGNFNSLILNMFRTKSNTFLNIYDSNASIAQQQITTINNTYRSVIDMWN